MIGLQLQTSYESQNTCRRVSLARQQHTFGSGTPYGKTTTTRLHRAHAWCIQPVRELIDLDLVGQRGKPNNKIMSRTLKEWIVVNSDVL